MRKYLIAIFLMLLCACTHQQYGNYTQISDQDNMRMADDSVRKLSYLYPPASTRFKIQQTAVDTYGAGLIQELRRNGYSIQESQSFGDILRSAFVPLDPQPSKIEVEDDNDIILSQLPPEAVESGTVALANHRQDYAPIDASLNKSLRYLVDQVGDGMYRVTLNVDSDTLSRVYATYDNRLVSAGSWTRKE